LSAVPYTFANASGQVPASQLDVNFANVKAAVDTAGIVTTAAQPNITSVGTLTALSVAGNVITNRVVSTSNVTGGNILTGGIVSAVGNIAGLYILGNGSQLTGVVSVSSYGNANVATFMANYGSNTISTTGNITSNYYVGNVAVLAGQNTRGEHAANLGASGFTELNSNVILQITGNANSYAQINFQNIGNGTAATTDYVATAQFGTDSTYFVNMGIASGVYDSSSPDNSLGNSLYAQDSYLYAQGGNSYGGSGGNLVVGSNEPGGVVRIIADGSTTNNIVATFSNVGVDVSGAISVSGNITAGNVIANNLSGPVFMANISSGQGVPTSPSGISQLPLVYDNVIANIGGNYVVGNSTTGSIFTASEYGFYQVSSSIGVTPSDWANVTNYSSAGVIGVYVNENPIASGPLIDFAGLVIGNTVLEVTTLSSISTLVELNVGDTLKCQLAYITTAPTNFWNTDTNTVEGYFQACWVRGT
jgi:hypothetical protein